MKKNKILFIALIGGLITAVLVWVYLASLERRYRQMSKPMIALVSKGYIAQGTVVKEQMVQVVKIPKEYIQPGALTSVRDLVNERGESIYVTNLPILEGEQISSTKLAPITGEMGLSTLVPAGKIAFPLNVDETNIFGGLLKPGNRVNILGTFEYEERNRTQAVTRVLLQNILVLSVGKRLIGDTLSPIKGAKSIETEQENSIITLAITLEEAALLTFAREKGSLSLILRPFGDESSAEVPPVDFSKVVPGKEKIVTSGAKERTSPFLEGIEKYQRQILETMKSSLPE